MLQCSPNLLQAFFWRLLGRIHRHFGMERRFVRIGNPRELRNLAGQRLLQILRKRPVGRFRPPLKALMSLEAFGKGKYWCRWTIIPRRTFERRVA